MIINGFGGSALDAPYNANVMRLAQKVDTFDFSGNIKTSHTATFNYTANSSNINLTRYTYTYSSTTVYGYYSAPISTVTITFNENERYVPCYIYARATYTGWNANTDLTIVSGTISSSHTRLSEWDIAVIRPTWKGWLSYGDQNYDTYPPAASGGTHASYAQIGNSANTTVYGSSAWAYIVPSSNTISFRVCLMSQASKYWTQSSDYSTTAVVKVPVNFSIDFTVQRPKFWEEYLL